MPILGACRRAPDKEEASFGSPEDASCLYHVSGTDLAYGLPLRGPKHTIDRLSDIKV